MLASEMITLIRSELLEPVAGFWSDDELLAWINRGEADYTNRIRGVEQIAEIQTVQGRPEYPLPSSWLSTRGVFYNDIKPDGTSDWLTLEPTTLEKLKQEHTNFLSTDSNVQDKPRLYWIWGRNLSVYPIPDTTGRTIKMFFKGKSIPLATVNDSLTVDDSLADAVKYYVLWKAWGKEKEAGMAGDARDQYLTYVGEGLRFMKRQQGDRVHQIDVRSNVPYAITDIPRGINPF